MAHIGPGGFIMATEKVGIYRKYHGKIPTDRSGQPLPKSEWPKKRVFHWAVRWFGSDGKRYSKSFKTRKEAERYAETKQSSVRNGRTDPPQTTTLKGFMAEHEEIMDGQVAPATLYDQMRALKMFTAHIGKDIRLMNISPRHAESFVAARLRSRVRISTVNKDIRTLSRVFNLAIEPRGYLPAGQNPFGKVKQRKVSLKPPRYVSPEELRTLLTSVPDTWWKTLITLAYTSAGRRDELLNLTWADVDFGKGNVHFSPKESSESLLAWEPKDHEARVVPIPAETVQLLADLQSEADEACPYVFIPKWRLAHILSRREQGAWKPNLDLVNNIIRDLEAMCRRAGVESFTLHDLRRSCITNWAQVLPIHVVQKLVGHGDIKTTQRYYLAVQECDLEKARQFQSQILGANLTDPKLTHSG
jgi:integrase